MDSLFRIYSPDSEEYKRLKAACLLMNKKDTKFYYYVSNIYFNFGQNWMFTTIIKGNKRTEYQGITQKDYIKLMETPFEGIEGLVDRYLEIGHMY